jgi:hypothetical protein
VTPFFHSEPVESEDILLDGLRSGERSSVQIQSVRVTPDSAHLSTLGDSAGACNDNGNDAESSSAASCAEAVWSEISREDLPLWNNLLMQCGASLYQFPQWNEPQRPMWLRPRYLVLEDQERLLAYVCILTVGFGPAKIGLVFRGPVLLAGQDKLPQEAMARLLAWTRAQGYMFIRFTHSESAVLKQVASAGDARQLDAFPYFLDYPILSPDYVVEQRESEAETLASFDREVRRKLRKAVGVGYEFRCADSPTALAGLWPLYQECAQRKGFRLERPLSVYMEAMRLSRPEGCAHLFAVYLNGKPVGSTLIFRDRDTAHCTLAAFDAEHKQSAVFLHWHSMRYMYAQGATRYNLGPGPGLLARFKEQFSRQGPECPPPLTMVLKPNWFRFWMKIVFPVAKKFRPAVRNTVSKLVVAAKPQVKRAPAKVGAFGSLKSVR